MHGMVVFELALALPLLFASNLVVRSLLAAASIDRGFDAESLLTVEVSLPLTKYPEPESRLAIFDELVRRVEALPGVASVTTLPLSPGTGFAGVSGPLTFEGQTEDETRDNPMSAIEMVGPSYFAVLGIPILRGRAFSPFDRLDSERVAMVSEEVASKYWPGQDPIGKTLGYREFPSPGRWCRGDHPISRAHAALADGLLSDPPESVLLGGEAPSPAQPELPRRSHQAPCRHPGRLNS
jgi:hypothetical protein